ncbi:hypothetical protein D3C86_1887740 [compost metagenome]
MQVIDFAADKLAVGCGEYHFCIRETLLFVIAEVFGELPDLLPCIPQIGTHLVFGELGVVLCA